MEVGVAFSEHRQRQQWVAAWIRDHGVEEGAASALLSRFGEHEKASGWEIADA
ncbi:hypothetical protein [Nonomuraea maheshkhaliensis]|uniref:hypothetical protein n=1 Tax=Nonomuraea maheshkhaliensis TaxID=419590 RepID=UPI0031F8AE32